MLRNIKIKYKLLPLKSKVNIIVLIFALIGSIISTASQQLMCDHINKHDLQIHNKNAKVGAQLITDLLNTTLVKIPNEHIFSPQYEKLTPMELKELGIVESDKVSDEYLENIDKYKTEYFNKLTIYNYPQKVVDRFTQIISDDLCVVIITDKNGQIPVLTSKYSQKLTGNDLYDIEYSRQLSIRDTIINSITNCNNPDGESFMIDETNKKFRLFYHEIKYDEKLWGYFIIAVNVDYIKMHQTQTQKYFISIIILSSIIIGVIIQKFLGV